MRIRWEADDGYCGASRPHFIEVPDDELGECGSREEQEAQINLAVQEDFNELVNPYWTAEDDYPVLRKVEEKDDQV